MKINGAMLCALLILLGSGSAARGGDAYLYPMYEDYWAGEPGPKKGGDKEGPAPAVREAPGEKKHPARQRVPGFLFPKKLGFGVAVGVPYDMFYLSDSYYLLEGSTWSRSRSYRGPWETVPRAKLPPLLLKHDLATIRRLRNREFREYFEKGERYRGRHFRPEFRPERKTKGKRPD